MRIVTWNTWWCFGPWQERQPRLVAAIAAQQPDVVLLQETWPDQARSVAEACGLEVIGIEAGPFHPQGIDGTATDHQMGNAMLADPARARLIGAVSLPSGDDRVHRAGVAVAWGTAAGSEVLAVATHLNHIASNHAVRQRQLERLRWWLGQVWPHGPVVLGGDLNLTPHSPEYGLAITPHWVDLWARTRPDDPGSTMDPANVNFRDTDWMDDRNGPGHPPGVRFDYLLARPLTPGPAGDPGLAVDAIELIGGADHGWPSDHLGLSADLEPRPDPGSGSPSLPTPQGERHA